MRKRKSPIVLVTTFVLIAVGVSGYNFATSRTGGNPAEQPPAPEVTDTKAVGESRPSASAADISKTVQGSMSTASAEHEAPRRLGGPPFGTDDPQPQRERQAGKAEAEQFLDVGPVVQRRERDVEREGLGAVHRSPIASVEDAPVTLRKARGASKRDESRRYKNLRTPPSPSSR